MRVENGTIAIIGGTSEELKTIKQLLEECVEDGSIIIKELQLPELQETCMVREKYEFFDLKELSRIIENTLIPECCEMDVDHETLEQTEKLRNKNYKNSMNNKQYKEPCMPTRHYWRGNIK